MDQLIMNKKPIGAVVKEADYVFTNLARRTKRNGVFYRIDWQYLNFIGERKEAPEEDVLRLLYSFGSKDLAAKVLKRFENDGLTIRQHDVWVITPKGEEVYQEVREIQQRLVSQALTGIRQADYETTLQTLQAIIDNMKVFLFEEKEGNEERAVLPAQPAHNPAAETIVIKQLMAQLEEAHNRKDPTAFARLFTDHAVFANAAGKRLVGRNAIYAGAKKAMETFMARSFAKYDVNAVRFIKEDVALVEVTQYPITEKGALLQDEPGGIPTFVMVKDPEDNQWQIVFGQNTIVLKN